MSSTTTTPTTTTTTTTEAGLTTADAGLKARHRRMWALGDYPAVAEDLVGGLGSILVQASGIGPGDRVLDVGAGSGNASIPAATTGASVMASDLTPELLAAGRTRAEARGVELTWREADAEALPFDDGAFDVVLSCLGVMFAPHHRAAADELVRVCRPGGTIALLNWTPGGFVGRLFAALKPFAPPPPPGVEPPPRWGDPEHVRSLFGDQVTDLLLRTETVTIDRFATAAEFRTYFSTRYGPLVAVYGAIADDSRQMSALDAALDDLVREFDRGTDALVMKWEYLLLTARRADGTTVGPTHPDPRRHASR